MLSHPIYHKQQPAALTIIALSAFLTWHLLRYGSMVDMGQHLPAHEKNSRADLREGHLSGGFENLTNVAEVTFRSIKTEDEERPFILRFNGMPESRKGQLVSSIPVRRQPYK